MIWDNLSVPCSTVKNPKDNPDAGAWFYVESEINPLNAKLNPICHLLALLGAHHILHVSRIRVNTFAVIPFMMEWNA
jgi:hypothetical protein